ncbi:putative zinc finger protein [Lentzea atacamensis]|uniref:Zinc finger protein n=1 Tax=Lentzea atacamensis TaxID=531938 RepID=A0A316HL39_9PSEU|nr:putative zinc finger protein [Lentzea atacamensis]RAS70538.1 putative zinc finger protein [Lentzea atacamensis]
MAYVLGSLSPGDRLAYERHLSACPPCEHEVCLLAGTAGLLSRVPAEWAVDSLTTAPPLPVTVLPGLAQAELAVRRRRLAITVVAILLAATVGAVLAHFLCP